MLNNQKGSVMSVAIIMIALLSFSLTSLTAHTYRTAENTNRVVEENSGDAEGKRLVNEAIARLKRSVNDLPIEEFEALTTDDAAYYDFRNDHIDPIEEALTDEDGQGIKIENTTDEDEPIPDGVHQIKFTVSYPMNESDNIVRDIYFTDAGVEPGDFNAFEYTMASNKSIALNGGNYVESTTIYGERIYGSGDTAYKDKDSEGNYNYKVVRGGPFNNPAGTDATLVTHKDYYCIHDPDNACLESVDGDLVIKENRYINDGESENIQNFNDVFMEFDFDTFFFDNLVKFLDMEESSINASNYSQTLREDADLTSVDPAIDQSSDYDLKKDQLIDGDATIDLDGNALKLEGHTLIVLGDLTINNIGTISRPGEIYVFGDVHIKNDQDLLMDANLYSYGEIKVKFETEHGFITNESDPKGMSLYAKNNILFERNITNSDAVPMFVFAEGSVKFDSALYPTSYRGAVYAQGKGDGLIDVGIDKGDADPEPFKGILVNSYSGTIDPNAPDGEQGTPDDSGNDFTWEQGTDYEEGDVVYSDHWNEWYKRTNHESGKGKGQTQAKPKSKFWTPDEGRPPGDPDNDHSFEFGALADENDDDATASTQQNVAVLNDEQGENASGVQRMGYNPDVNTDQTVELSFNTNTNSVQNTSASTTLQETFYDLPEFEELVITPSEEGIITQTSTFKYE